MSPSPESPSRIGLDDRELREVEALVAAAPAAPARSARRRFGERPTLWHGLGMETIDTRPYVEGDDLRHLDWRATARSGRPLSKVFSDERHHGLCLVVDHREPMRFASRGEPKGRRSSRCAALVALTATRRREAVSLVRLGRSATRFVPPTRDIAALVPVLRGEAGRSEAIPPRRLPDLFIWLDRAIPPSSTILVASDFHDFRDSEDAIGDALAPLAGRHAVAVAVIRDPIELELPDAGWLRLVDADGRDGLVDTRDAGLRRRFREIQRRRLERIASACRRTGVPWRLVLTDEPIGPVDMMALL